MSKEIIVPSNVHPSRGYSHAIKVGNTVYVSGQVGVREDNQVPAEFKEQAGQALENLKRVLTSAGASFDNIVKLNIYVKTLEFMDSFRELRRNYFGDYYPASTLVQVVSLARPELLIEIEAIAVTE
ncbi:MAG: RidA family protein [Chloroflexi bacterium]|nr:RidA family protein [Chloroflexota bacterium]